MFRPTLAVFAAALAGGPAAAASYSATLAQPTSNRFIARDIVWSCGPAACQGATDNGRPLVLCQSLAKRAGHIEAFVVNGRALVAADLDRCNASAKAAPTRALASQ